MKPGPLSARLCSLLAERTRPDGRRYTVQEVADGTGLSTSYLRYLLSGERGNPSMANIQVLSTFFGVPPGYLFGERPCASPEQCLTAGPLRELVRVLADMSDTELALVREFADRLMHLTRTSLNGSSAGPHPPS